MGTNYYQRTDICECCGRYKQKHIGKSSAGWQFSFKGYVGYEDVPKIQSFEDWKRELQADGQIFTEYGEEVSYEDFVKLVKDKKTGKWGDKPNMNHYNHCKAAGYNTAQDWKDEQGHSFTGCEFS